jgi:hypothetical protein
VYARGGSSPPFGTTKKKPLRASAWSGFFVFCVLWCLQVSKDLAPPEANHANQTCSKEEHGGGLRQLAQGASPFDDHCHSSRDKKEQWNQKGNDTDFGYPLHL